jgi:hypothetical protein
VVPAFNSVDRLHAMIPRPTTFWSASCACLIGGSGASHNLYDSGISQEVRPLDGAVLAKDCKRRHSHKLAIRPSWMMRQYGITSKS